ncbi:16S rRNA (uracil(1498)-N(3))-methyltransferase [Kibdelosporangium philippinense]|uniref:Ribosomal RNA small subunit methyltransferase E n=1 Tax=Kibdelosporangium philippinense TaxID=211113 RepID=A0ABS8ZV70_9PSEU|nr:16S rRNA (uracil(1498)-N(3))-methyltransferase [Kibdelosporangium philippinense]MCE7011629.1 16S rRNA (uracil(1498)-N(3))-methyltransferase [Kibdelosporangium philippinense]
MSTTPPLFLVDTLPKGEEFVLDGPEGRHAATVKRLRPGENLTVSDGAGGLATCVVDSPAGKDSLRLRVIGRSDVPAPQPRVVIAQALVKGDRGELAVELATEAGADAIVPWRASRCVAKWEDGPRGEKALARWRNTVREAAKQARRPWVPEVHDPVDTKGLAKLMDGAAGLVLEGSAKHQLTEISLPQQGDIVVVVGPEGGVSEEEIAVLESVGAQAVRLGPSVLRASTAAAVALGAIGALTARWS